LPEAVARGRWWPTPNTPSVRLEFGRDLADVICSGRRRRCFAAGSSQHCSILIRSFVGHSSNSVRGVVLNVSPPTTTVERTLWCEGAGLGGIPGPSL